MNKILLAISLLCLPCHAIEVSDLEQIYSSPAPVRQTVLYGRLDDSGYPNALEISGGQLCVNASSVPLVASVASGYSPYGAKDYVAYMTGSVYLTVNSGATSYVFLERNPYNGRIGISTSPIAPEYGYVKPTCTEGKYFYGINDGQMFQCENGNWEKSYSLCIGETDGTSAITYAYGARYDSGWFAHGGARSGNIKSHNIGTEQVMAQLWGATDINGAGMALPLFDAPFGSVSISAGYTLIPTYKTINFVPYDNFRIGNTSTGYTDAGYARLLIKRAW